MSRPTSKFPVTDSSGWKIEALDFSCSGKAVLTGIYLAFGPGEFVCLLGPSGCGKTRLLDLGIVPGNDVQIFELKSPPAVTEAARSGEVDAGTVCDPQIVRAVESGLKVVATSQELLPGHPCCRLSVKTRDITERPQVIAGFLAALLKAEKFGHEHRDAAVDIITKYLKLDRHIIDKSYLNDQPTDPDLANTTRVMNVMRHIGYADQERDIASYVDTRFYKRALDKDEAAEPTEPFWKQLEKDYVQRDTPATPKS